MYHSLEALFSFGIQPAFDDYLASVDRAIVGDGSLLRPARTTIEQLYHFGEHYRLMQDDSFTTDRIKQLCPAYGLLGNVVNAAKHHTINRHSPVISQANQLSETILIIRYQDQLGEYPHFQVMSTADLNDGTRIDLLQPMIELYNFWGQLLCAQGLIKQPVSHTYTGGLHPVPRELASPAPAIQSHPTVAVSFLVIVKKHNPLTNEYTDVPIVEAKLVSEPAEPAQPGSVGAANRPPGL